MPFEWLQPPSTVFEQMGANYAGIIRNATELLLESYAPRIEEWMKENAPWQDVTGRAREELWAETLQLANDITLAFGHGVEYGDFLELAHGGRFQIVSHALDYWAPKIWADVQEMLR